ncbi:hypothetical protein TrCOL_g4363 [Triparma columacea]|uniref:Choline transporter-like protein n=1 Tax=Triparma columacea TaxID=722753 RepID=A0A9W7GEE9_9STRA|nr:hypothetical protein TrCOL_g4363 [Triparma columacea]
MSDPENKVAPRVNHRDRKYTDVPCAILFLAAIGLFFGIGFAFVGSKNVDLFETASDFGINTFEYKMSDSLKEDADACCAELTDDEKSWSFMVCNGRRRLDAGGFPSDGGMLDVFAIKPGIPATLIAAAVFISIGWIALLRQFATPIVFLTEAIKVACIFFIAIKTDDSSAMPVFFIIGIVYACLVIWKRDKLKFAGRIISHSCMALQKNPSMFGGLLGIKALYCLQAFCFVTFVSQSAEVMEVAKVYEIGDEYTAAMNTCVLQNASWVGSARSILMFCWLWSIMFYTQARLGVISFVIGSWHFHPNDMPSVLSAVLTVFTKSLGTVSFSALLLAIIERIKKSLKFKWYHHCGPQFCITVPFACLAMVLLWCLETCLKMLTKFTLILHIFSGDNFFGSAKKCWGLLTRHFENAFVTEVTSRAVLTIGAYVFSIALAFSAWAWIDSEFGWKSLSTASDEGGSLIRFFGWFLMMLFNLWYPTLGIFLMIVIDMILTQWGVGGQEYWVAPFAAVFVGIIAMLFFTYMAGVVLDTIDVCFVCWAVDKDNNVDLSESEFNALVMELPDVKKAPNLGPNTGLNSTLLSVDQMQMQQPSAPPVVQGQPVLLQNKV